MSDDTNTTDNDPIANAELEALQNTARTLGIEFHHRLGADKLALMIKAKQDELAGTVQNTPIKIEVVNQGETPEQKERRLAVEKNIRQKRAQELIRVRVTCMNPNKKDWEGEILQVANREVRIKKYIPFNAENGWHIERMLLDMMREKKCQIFKTITRRDGNKVRQGYLVNEFSIEVLPPLSPEELGRLATKQAAEASLED